MTASASLILLLAAQAPGATIPMNVVSPWQVEVGEGEVNMKGVTLEVAKKFQFEITPPPKVEVRGEAYETLPLFNPKAGGWRRGAQMKGLIAEECTATGALMPGTVRVKAGAGDGPPYVMDEDYALDPFWATLGRLEGGKIAGDTAVYMDYDYTLCRLDTIVVDKSGTVSLLEGPPSLGVVLPAGPGEGQSVLGRIWVESGIEGLDAEHLFPVDFGAETPPAPSREDRERLLPKTLEKLRKGEKLHYLAWGDSVTNGGGVGHAKREMWYQTQFVKRLAERYPDAEVKLTTSAWGGSSSRSWLTAKPDAEHVFTRDVVEIKADLVSIEFVNDAYLHGEALETQYEGIIQGIRETGAEIIFITPHLVRPDWMKMDTLKFDEDPRPYVRDLKAFAAKHDIAVADGSAHWCCLQKRGIPYITLLANCINHPEERGHKIFADALMDWFE